MHWIDWAVIVFFLISMVGVGMYFTRRAGKNIDSFFVSGRSLKWYIAGASMIATGFAADTPLWVGSLVRQYGLHAVWQYWAPLIGIALSAALFSRMWRRTEVVTDIEILELRYTGNSARSLRAISATMGALIMCPLIIGWVSKAMVTIAQEVMGIGGQSVEIAGFVLSSEMLATLIVMGCALLMCAFSGLYGVVYTDFIQFILAIGGAFLLAWLSIREVGGLREMVMTLSADSEWAGRSLNIAPQISATVVSGGRTGTMSIWNAIGFFGILWWGNAMCGGHQAQRVLACKNPRHSSNAVLMHGVLYFAVICWPWIIVALCSLIVFPDMGVAGHDAAYPRMLMHILPVGIRGVMVAALMAAFISTVSTLFNWGSSYIVNDLYSRFLFRRASDKHYVRVARIVTVLVACAGGVISFKADNIQQLLQISYVVGGGAMVVGASRWLWWRINATGEIVAFITNWIVGILMLFGHHLFRLNSPLLDRPMSLLLRLPEGVSFTADYDLLGARMLFMMIIGLTTVVTVSLCTPPVEMEQLQRFVRRTRIFTPGWGAVVRGMEGYVPAQTVRRTLVDWGLIVMTIGSLLFAMANLIRYRLPQSAGMFVLFAVLLMLVLRRTRRETEGEVSAEDSSIEES